MHPIRFLSVGLLLTLNLLATAQSRTYRHRTDKQTLGDQTPTIMPYNRLAQSAGTVLTYGDPRLENHTLDVMQLPGSKQVVVEDRYGIAVVNQTSRAIAGASATCRSTRR